jgi:hypothetical protein
MLYILVGSKVEMKPVSSNKENNSLEQQELNPNSGVNGVVVGVAVGV